LENQTPVGDIVMTDLAVSLTATAAPARQHVVANMMSGVRTVWMPIIAAFSLTAWR
jgi:hypothetical protein